MKKTNRASIHGMSFNIEEEAYVTLEKYLNDLEKSCSSNDNSREIIDGIEERMAEILQDKAGKDGVVTDEMAEEVMKAIGKPEELFNVQEQSQHNDKPKKKLFRNPEDKQIAGVFGGIAAYFGIQAVWLRLGYAALTAFSIAFDSEYFNPVVFAIIYVILWICMPAAKSNQQRREMYGKATTTKGSDAVSTLAKICLITVGAFFAMIGFAGIIGIFAAVLGVAIAGFAMPDFFSSLLNASGTFPEWAVTFTKICTAIVAFLPCIALAYAGIRLIFSFKAPKWKPGLWMLLIWILALVGLSVTSVKTTRNFWNTEDIKISETLDVDVDTLFVKFTDVEKWADNAVIAEGDFDEYSLSYLDMSDKKQMKLIAYPTIELDRDDYGQPIIETETELFTRAMTKSERDSVRTLNYYTLSGDTLYVSPVVYGGENKIKQAEVNIEVNLPRRMKLVITGPYPHEFDQEFVHKDIDNFLFQ